MTHRYVVGQTVNVTRKVLRPAAPGSYEIRGLVPPSESNPQDPCYRVRSAAENYDRVVPESELTLISSNGPRRD